MPTSCSDPRATYAYCFCEATAIDESRDAVLITDIKSYGKLVNGVETFIVVEVEYSLSSQEDAKLCVMFNNSKVSSGYIHEGTIPVQEGSGKYVFTIPLTPIVHWEGTPFSIQCCLHERNNTLCAHEKVLKVYTGTYNVPVTSLKP